ncbi:ATP-binding protein [Halosquirtibacter xylanolyticus]|uniref:ATP-binding protein n=1 Tax=Halosquirtibacter xylanolyticus TaxID=3374599 RepID=UPI003748BBFD|nr:ATP-binding protein [Prolixibacteraceae bacterium]
MKEIADHIIDLIENSIRADAKHISVVYKDDGDKKSFCIEDNGKGMSSEEVSRALDPFYTTKTSKRIGLGLSLTRQSVLQSHGVFHLYSTPKKGTKVIFTYPKKDIDCPPNGDIIKSMVQSIMAHPDIDFSLSYQEKENVLVDTSFLNYEERLSIKYSDLYAYVEEAYVEIDWNGF